MDALCHSLGDILETLDIVVIVLQVLTCYACYVAGKFKGIGSTIDLFLDKEIITQDQLDKIVEDDK